MKNRFSWASPDNLLSTTYHDDGWRKFCFNDTRITEFTRNIMQREIGRTQGKLTTTFNRDPLIRMATQVVQADGASPVIKRDYIYDATGNLIRCHDIRSGVTNYQYDSLGQISQVTTPIGEEIFAFDPAHNIVEHYTHKVDNNRLEQYHGVQYRYDEFGNVMQKTTQTGEQQHYTYNLKDQLITATMSKPNQETEVWHYEYDVLGRRIAKYRENTIDENSADENNAQNSERTEFIWDGSHLVQEINPQGTYTYIYSHPSSYEPLAQIYENKENKQSIAYFHTDQIGIPREMTDENGQLLWNGTYTAWGELKEENNPHNTHQPLRLQNQYYDRETGLHYNFFRYYDTHCGRFITQDPIKLQGGNNFYQFAPNTMGWSDPLGLFVIVLAAIPVILEGLATAVGAGIAGFLTSDAVLVIAGSLTMASVLKSDAVQEKDEATDTCVGKCNKPKCPDDVYKRLTQAVHDAKKEVRKLGGCSQNMGAYDMKIRATAWKNEALARSIREQTCWEGGDYNHQKQIADAWKNHYRCQELLQ